MENKSRQERRPGPAKQQWKIAESEWPTVLGRIEKGESLRTIAESYDVSYEAIRRIVLVARQK